MSAPHLPASTTAIAARMEAQRVQLHRQFVEEPLAIAARSAAAASAPPAPSTAMQPYQPRSFLMRMLVANPQLIQRLGVLAVTAVVGARYSSWGLRLLGLFLTARKHRS